MTLPRPPVSAAPLSEELLVARVRNGVVTVLAGDGWSSGIVLSNAGLILTAAAPLKGSTEATVVTSDGVERKARLVAVDVQGDVALLQAEGSGFKPLRALLDAPAVGQPILAVGTPFHPALSFSTSRGKLTGQRARLFTTDVRVSPGNAGGPVVDPRGRVVGIVSWPVGRETPTARASCVTPADAFKRLGLKYGD